jgi:hypothetical protein
MPERVERFGLCLHGGAGFGYRCKLVVQSGRDAALFWQRWNGEAKIPKLFETDVLDATASLLVC